MTVKQSSLLVNPLPSMEVHEVSPELARAWLERNLGNRPIRQANLRRLVAAMKSGNWRMTGDPIRFSNSGKLIDGQHRLMAIVESGLAFPCVVMRGLDDAIFDVLDSGASRSKADVLFTEYGLPVETAILLSSIASIAYHYDSELYSFRSSVTKESIVEFVRAHPALIDSAIYTKANLVRESPCAKAIAGAFHYYASALDPHACERFLERFMRGIGLSADDNLLHLRNLCYSARSARRPLGTRELFGRLIKFWNSERRGKPIKYAGNAGLRQDEAFPKFI